MSEMPMLAFSTFSKLPKGI